VTPRTEKSGLQPIRNKARGFTLLELCIVLLIFAIVVGAVIAAAENFYYRNRLNFAVDEMNQIVSNMHSLYSGQNASGLVGIGYVAFTTQMIATGVFPPYMITGGAIVNNPWNGTSASNTVEVSRVKGTPTQFTVRFLKVPFSACADFVIRNSQPGVDSTAGSTLPGGNGLSEICVTGAAQNCYLAYNPTSPGSSQLPMTPVNANAACSGNGPFTIDWYYNLGG
jgi:prepilin-type N-terminal cleavage/methylation domain-containing protein